MAPTLSQVRRLLVGRPFELLLVPANLLSLRLRRGLLQALIYHSDRRERMPSAPSRCMVRCWRSRPDASAGEVANLTAQ